MSSWTIYSKNGVAKYTVKELEFHDTWMGEEYVMVNITSPTPLDIEIGDYLMYRGLTYSVYSVPGALKQARRGSYGEAFKYDNVKLSSRGTELTDIRFLDYVLDDNNIHYTSLPTFSFHCMTVDDLLDRLQANTDRDGGNQWYFISPSYSRTMQRYQSGTAAYTEAARLWEEYFGGSHSVEPVYERTDVNISIDKQSVWDGLTPIKNDFNLNFIMRERAVIVGGEGISAEHVFRYGKGNGLYQIERVADQDQKVTTKLFAYGSDKNLPIRYYANVTRICFAKMYARPSVDSNILYLDFVWSRSYVTGAADSEGKFPVVVSINGTTYQVKAYPMEVGARTLFTIEATTSLGFVTTNMDIIFVSGIDKDKFPASNVRQESGALPNNMAVQVLMLPGFPQYALSELCRSTISGGYTIFEIRKTPSSAYNEFMRIEGNHTVTFSDDPLQPFIISGNADTLGIKEGDVHYTEENDDNGLKEIYPSIEGMTRGDVEGTSSEERLDEIVSCDVIQDNGVFAEGVEIQNFNLVLKNIGFDLKQAFDNAGGNMTISMKDGYCGGRDFNVHSVNANSNGTWTLNVERSHDDGLDLYFPYSTNAAIGQTPTADEPYQIRTGDHFVLTEIEIGDTSYIWAAAMKMLRKSITYLLNNDYTRFTYLPKVDEIYMARQHDESQTQAGTESLHDTLKSGMLMLFDDEDLGVDGSVFIDSVTIKENGNNGLPTYDVVLRNDKQVGTMQRIQNQIQSLTSYVSGGGGGLSVAQIRSLINAYGAGLFLSKLNDDAAQGVITFIRGLISQAYTQFGAGADFGQFVQGLVGGDGARIDEHGNMEATSLVLRSFLEAPKLVYNHVDVRVGDEWQSNGAGEIESVEIDQNNPLQGTIKLHLLDGEYGTIKPQDKCKGIFHHLEGYNDTETKDDGKGGRTFAGFYTSYFVALSVSGGNNEYIHYELRPTIEVNGQTYWQNDQGASSGIRGGFHPSAHMVFAQYSNAADNTRQSCQYRTTTYTRMLSGMTGWDEGLANVAFQIGNTPLIASAYNIPDAGQYSLWINGDIYFAGTLNRVDSWGRDVADYPDQGNYFSTIQYHLNDLVHYDGSVWRMAIENEATLGVTPGTSVDIGGQTIYPWVKWIYADSMNPSGKWNHTLVPYAANCIVNIEGMLLISKRSTSQPPIDLLTDENSEPLQTETGEYIVYSDEVNDDWELLFDVGDLTNGKDGQNAIMVNLTNDTDTVLSDEQGNIIGDLPATTAQLYDGVTLITSGVSWTCQTVGCTATINPQGVVSITAMSADEAKVACIATYNTKTYTKVFTFKKLYGKDKLWLEPSVDKIERYVSGITDNQRSYAYAPSSIRFKAYIQKSGQEPRELTASDGYILLGTNTTHYASGQEINVASIASLFVGNHLPVLLKDASGNTQDVEDIVMTEAQDSITSAGAWTYERQIRNNELVSLFGNIYRAKQDSKGVSPVELLTNENNVPLQDENGEYIAYNFNTNTTYYELWIKGSYVIRTEVMYAKGTDGTTTPTSGWSFTKPSVTYGDWLWIRTEVIRSDENNSVSYSVSYVGTNGVDGKNAVRVDLDNENDSMLYDGNGTLISGNAVSHASLYDGQTKIDNSILSWIIKNTSNVTATISGNTITVTAISANSGSVAVATTYNGKEYSVIFSVKKLVGVDKYEIRTIPNAITYNPNTGGYSQNSVIVDVYRISQNGGRNKITSLPTDYKLQYSVNNGTNWTNISPSGSIAKSKFTGDNILVRLLDSDSKELDGETIPIISDGTNGVRGNFKSTVFKRTNSTPSAPTGGSYETPVPSGWSDGIPEGSAILWASICTFYGAGGSSGWSTPRPMTNTSDFEARYSSVASSPGTPATNPSNWSTTASSSTIWMATRECHNGTWDSWQVSKVKGEKGDNAIQLALAVSPDTIALNAEGNFKTGSTLTIKIQKTDGSVTTNIQKSSTATFKLWVGSNGYDISDYNSSTKSYSISLAGKNIQSDSYVHVTYVDGDINLDKSVSVTQDGSQGLQGCVTRVSEWKAGVTYKHDSGLALGYIDVVGVRNSNAADGTGWDFYECKTEHTASTSDQPLDTSPYWTKLNNLGATYTSLLIADNAFIRFGTGNELRIVGSNDKIQAGMRGGTENADGVRIWAGNIYDGNNNIDLNLAPFRVLQNGKLYATDAYIRGEIHATDGEFTGKIIATSGKITGNLAVTGDGILTIGDTEDKFIQISPSNGSAFTMNQKQNGAIKEFLRMDFGYEGGFGYFPKIRVSKTPNLWYSELSGQYLQLKNNTAYATIGALEGFLTQDTKIGRFHVFIDHSYNVVRMGAINAAGRGSIWPGPYNGDSDAANAGVLIGEVYLGYFRGDYALTVRRT